MQFITIDQKEPEVLDKKELAELEKQAKGNDAEACYRLWRYYCYGQNRRMNKARKMLEKAAELNHPTALLTLASELSTSNNERAYPKGVEYMRRAADLGEPNAQVNMGNFCRLGFYCEENMQEALDWYKKAAAQGHTPAMMNLGVYYQHKLQKDGDKSAAEPMLHWFRQAAQGGFAPAQSQLAAMLREGMGVPVNMEEAFQWCSKAAEQGDLQSVHNLALFYYHGDIVEKDWAKAVSYFRMAAEGGFAHSQFNLGSCYLNGEGVEKDAETGIMWLNKSAKQDDLMAVKALCQIYKGQIEGLEYIANQELQQKYTLQAIELGDPEHLQMLTTAISKLTKEVDSDEYDDIF